MIIIKNRTQTTTNAGEDVGEKHSYTVGGNVN
jgi:hypothetical protein